MHLYRIISCVVIFCTLTADYHRFLSSLQETCNSHGTLLLTDCEHAHRTPPLRNFRMVCTDTHLLKKRGIATDGLHRLRASGSSQFTPCQLIKIQKKIAKHSPDVTLYVVDLRQEYHGFLTTNAEKCFPICWYKSSMNCINWQKNRHAIKDTEADELDSLNKNNAIQVYVKDSAEWPSFGKPLPHAPHRSFSVRVAQTLTEKQLVTQRGARYKRFYVADRQAPTPHEVDTFVTFVTSLPDSAWLHFHCRAGQGRTTTFLALYDMMHNAQTVSADAIIKRQSVLANYDLTASHNNPIIAKLRKARLKFLYDFHAYVNAAAPTFDCSYSEWLEKKA